MNASTDLLKQLAKLAELQTEREASRVAVHRGWTPDPETTDCLPTGTVLDALLGGLPPGLTVLVGSAGMGKTRSALVAASELDAELVLTEDCWEGAGRVSARMKGLGCSEPGCVVDASLAPCTWKDISQHLSGEEAVVLDSITGLTSSTRVLEEEVVAVRRWAMETGCFVLATSQVRTDGDPAGGAALLHYADSVVALEEATVGSKAEGEKLGLAYRDTYRRARVLKSAIVRPLHGSVVVTMSELGVPQC